MTGFATSVIGCGCEAAIESVRSPQQTPDGRPGVRVLMFAVSTAELQKQLQNRVGQCVLTSPGSACYAGIDAGDDKLKLGDAIRFFGDGWQIAKRLGARRYWRVPVMDGEFVCESTTYLTKKAVGGGNLIIMGAEPGEDARGDGGGGRRRCARSPTSSCRFRAASRVRDRRSARNTRARALRPTTFIVRP